MSILASIRARQAALAARKGALADRYPEMRDVQHIYSSAARFAAAEADSYTGAAGLYRSYVWVRKAVALYAQNVAPLRVGVVNADGQAIPNHPLSQLYAAPNMTMPLQRLRAMQVTHLLLSGERFVEIVDDERGRPRELWPRRPDTVKVRPDEAEPGYPSVAGYYLEELAEGQRNVPRETVIHELLVNPLSAWRGLGMIAAVAEGIATDIASRLQAQLFYQNAARPDYAIGAGTVLTPDERRRLESQIDAKYGPGGTRYQKPIILEAGQTISVLGWPQKDLLHLDQQQATANEVAAIFSVPDILMGFGNDSYDTEEKRDAAMATFWALALLPFVQAHDATETHFWSSVRPLLRPGERIATDLSGIAVLNEKLGPKLELANKLFAMGVPFNTIDGQLKLGVGAIPGGDVGYLPSGLAPVGQEPPTGAT